MAQTKAELEEFYKTTDPWAYETTPDDAVRKERILEAARTYGPSYARALDVGAGHGWITKDLPAGDIDAIEISDKAAALLSEHVSRVSRPIGKYDLVVATGVLYDHYDVSFLEECVLSAASRIIITSHIKEWSSRRLPFRILHEEEFPYREFHQHLIVYDTLTPQNRAGENE